MRTAVLAVCAGCALLAGCSQPPPLPVLGAVPDFELVSQTGERFDGKSLDGHIWVANFVFTNCDGPCPRMSSQMRQLQVQTASMPSVKLVSFTVDPKRDTPEVLAAYAKHFQPDPQRWFFLTGEQERLHELGLKGFKLNPVDGQLSHSTRFVLVDRKRQIRSYQTSTEDGFVQTLVRDIRRLERET